ncbi:MAG TPA: polysaccharide deacetylase family protein [Acidimicrobiales bacterium]|nr:polysaccharide deacetylase family protein [Acidimicrobiales bacterium]
MTADGRPPGTVCLTVDVEDWYEGMAVLGQDLERPPEDGSGLGDLASRLAGRGAAVTLFVVANYAAAVRDELGELAASGHEVASHGPDHGRLPESRAGLLDWLRRGRERLEEVVEAPVRGFRSPRFDVPASLGLEAFRETLAEAGFEYVSDRHRLGDRSPLRELPVLHRGRVPLGGGSYQRFLPRRAITKVVDSAPGPVVLYYHSYDFGAGLPAARSIRSWTTAKQVIGRRRIGDVFSFLLDRYGSELCSQVGDRHAG